uniref:Uncharacterized protein n=1 Tax=Arundo donax TaxID=35708 RepID=A0A0A8XS97_ARUDO
MTAGYLNLTARHRLRCTALQSNETNFN